VGVYILDCENMSIHGVYWIACLFRCLVLSIAYDTRGGNDWRIGHGGGSLLDDEMIGCDTTSTFNQWFSIACVRATCEKQSVPS
jgi:hypothetical protein